MNIPIFTDDPGWHGEELKTAFAKRNVKAQFVSLQDCILNIAHENCSAPNVQIPFFAQTYPIGAFIRGVSGGTLQQVIVRLNILHILAMQNVLIYNSGKAIERTVDKAMTSFLLKKNGIATPATWVCESRAHADKVRENYYNMGNQKSCNKPLVIKPLFGSQGLGVRKLMPQEPLPVPMQMHVDGVYYLQEFIVAPSAPHDYRLFVIAGKVVAAMKRTAHHHWVNNVAAGGDCECVTPNEEMVNIAINAAKAVEIDYCGVDIIESVSGEYYVLEVNSIPAWKGLQSVTKVNIAQLLVDDFLSKLAH